jgi:hypothetical protein
MAASATSFLQQQQQQPATPRPLPDDSCVAVWHVLAELVYFLLAGLLHGVLEVYVLTEANLLVKEDSSADAVQLLTVALQAAYHTR